MMFPEGFISCKVWCENKQKYIIYFHVFEDSADFVSAYLTDSDVFLTAKEPVDELRRVASELGVTDDAEIISILKLSVKQEILHFDEHQLQVTLPFCHGIKSSTLVMRFNAISKCEEKEECLKFLLFQLAGIAEDKCDLSEFGKSQLAAPTKNESLHGHTSSLRPHKIAPKRRGPGMSIVNPGSKRVHMKRGVQYDEEGSDN